MLPALKKNSSVHGFPAAILYLYLSVILLSLIAYAYGLSVIILILLITIVFVFFGLHEHRRRKHNLQSIEAIVQGISDSSFAAAQEIIAPVSFRQLENGFRKLYEKLLTEKEYRQKLERVRAEFLGNVSHELKTPLFAVHGFIETLLNGAIDDKEINRIFLEKANKHTENLSALLNDLIDISMMESGEMRMSYRYFDIVVLVKEIIEEMQPLAFKKGLPLTIQSEGKEQRVYGDRQRIRQVLVNLITNAVKYTEQGSVSISVLQEGKWVRVAVTDTGIGIGPGDIGHVFERFYRVDKARSREFGGTGLGLAIAKHIIEVHESKLEVISSPGKGSEFYFYLKK